VHQELEITLFAACVNARGERHEFLTVEHLLLALLDNPSAAEVLRACHCDIEELRNALRDFIVGTTPILPADSGKDVQPTPGFQRATRGAINGADVLVAILGEEDSRAVYYLHQQGVTRPDVVSHIPPERVADDPAERPSVMAQELKATLHRVIGDARQVRHEFFTVEDLLLALLDNPSAGEVLRACARNVDELRNNLHGFVLANARILPADSEWDTQPSLGFQHVIQRTFSHVQTTYQGKRQATGAHVLAAIFEESDSYALSCLHEQGVTRPNVERFISRVITEDGAGDGTDVTGEN